MQRYGEPAPGPGVDHRLFVQPSPDTLRAVPSWEWLRLHIDPARSRPIVQAARVADAIERCAGLPPDEADRRLRTLPGVGVWTSAEVRQRALGDADAVSFGDYHVAKDVGWALTGTPFDDDQLAGVPRAVAPAPRAGAGPARPGPARPPPTRSADGAARRTCRRLRRAQFVGSEQRPQRAEEQSR